LGRVFNFLVSIGLLHGFLTFFEVFWLIFDDFHSKLSSLDIKKISYLKSAQKTGSIYGLLKLFLKTFFFRIFRPTPSPPGIDPKKWKRSKRVFYRYFIISPVTFLMSNCILQGWNLTLAVQMPFLIIFIFSGLFLGGSRAKNSKKKSF
jgi:hypothetical protein